MFPENICAAVDQIDALKADTAQAALNVTTNPALVDLLGKSLVILAQILREFHHCFDYPINPVSITEDNATLMAWAATYDKSFAHALALYQSHNP